MITAPTLSISLEALTSNYRLLAARTDGECAAVVKANAYGLGVEGVAPALEHAGCKRFFVATLDEGVQLRAISPSAEIHVFHGPYAGEEKEYAAHALIPVINTVSQLERWSKVQTPYALHVDSGMTRLGISAEELDHALDASLINPAHCTLIMSHLACANEPDHPKNAEQLTRFTNARKKLPRARASLANSSGLFLDNAFHFDIARPGCALYGINPTGHENPLRHVATLSAPMIQQRVLQRSEDVGYGATYHAAKGARLAVVQLGYADGWFRALSTYAYVGGVRVPVAGRVSMDMIVLDVSAAPDASCAEFINEIQPVDAVADAAGTIGYEIFTRLGRRVRRIYA